LWLVLGKKTIRSFDFIPRKRENGFIKFSSETFNYCIKIDKRKWPESDVFFLVFKKIVSVLEKVTFAQR